MTLAEGQRVADRFTVVRVVGEGGMGVVYEVTDARFRDAHRALKLMRAEKASDPAARKLFVQEVTAAASVKSRHVVQVYEFDVDAETPWMLMELLAGASLDAWVNEHGPLPWAEARLRVVELGHALDAAHKAGQLHLDLKPANLFLAREDDAHATTTLKVLDFGLSRQIVAGRSSVLQSRAIGTEAWMPPEQMNARAQLRATADVWPLGLIAFWMLTGKYYWLAVEDTGDIEDTMAFYGELAKGAVVTASARAVERGASRALPVGFDAWFAKCLASKQEDRWSDGGAATRALVEVLDRASTSAPPAPEVTPTPPAPPREPAPAVRQATVEAARPETPHGVTTPVQVLLRPPSPTPIEPPLEAVPVSSRASRTWAAVGGAAVLAAAAAIWGLTRPSASVTAASDGGHSAPDGGVIPAAPMAPPRPACPTDMRLVQGGEFSMGSPDGQGESDEHPQHRVRVATFCMDPTEVSVAQYRACVTAGVCTAPNAFRDVRGNANYFCNWERPGADDHPVNCVDWNQSRAFCAWIGNPEGARRLPREAEWEYAARGTAGRTYPWGDAAPDGTRTNLCGDECVRNARAHGFSFTGISGWHDDFGATAPVTAFESTGATPEGVLNLGGNVLEWVEDVYQSDAYAHHDSEGFIARDASVPSQSTESRVLRGGSWNSYGAAGVRAAVRFGSAPAGRISLIGFRCARGAIFQSLNR